MSSNSDLRETPDAFAAEIVAAYVSNNAVPPAELPALIEAVRAALSSLGAPQEKPAAAAPPTPAVSIKKSVTPDHIVCLECGKGFKSLKRHLLTHHGLGPDEYRQRWGLAATYPMVAPNYADARSQLALSMGLGRKRGAEPDDADASAPSGEEADAAVPEAAVQEPAAAEPVGDEPPPAENQAEEQAEPAEAPKRRGGGRRKAASA